MAPSGSMDPRTFRAGTRVEICPFRNKRSHHYIAHLDGEQGVIEGPGQDGAKAVRLAYNRASVEFPVDVLKIVASKATEES
jgi:hypothetical protein